MERARSIGVLGVLGVLGDVLSRYRKTFDTCGMGLAVGDEVVDSKRVTPVRSREADEPEGR
jgi:hypothetical protein